MDYLKIINYNIGEGCMPRERRTLLEEFIDREKPQILVYQELCHLNGNSFAGFAARFGHDYSVILKDEGYPVGVSSQQPLEVIHRQRRGFWHGFLHVVWQDVHIIAVHLSPVSTGFRRREAKRLMGYLSRNGLLSENLVVCGDFNAPSPHDAEYMEEQASRRLSHGSRALRRRRIDFSVLSQFLDGGLHDVCRGTAGDGYSRFIPSYPTPVAEAARGRGFPGERIDFQLVSAPMLDRLEQACVVQDDLTDLISDHYPVRGLYSLSKKSRS